MRSADVVIWAFPLYILLGCSQYKRFIELITERGAQSAFRGKHAVTLFAEDFFTSIERGMGFSRLSAALPVEPPRPYRPVSPVRPADTRGRAH